jgi:hypothetical protein
MKSGSIEALVSFSIHGSFALGLYNLDYRDFFVLISGEECRLIPSRPFQE